MACRGCVMRKDEMRRASLVVQRSQVLEMLAMRRSEDSGVPSRVDERQDATRDCTRGGM